MTGQTSGGRTDEHATEVARGERFEFGKNWANFLNVLDDTKIANARKSLAAMLGTDSLAGKRVLDIGSGSGLSSLVMYQMGASAIVSFDYDPNSVACTRELKRRYAEHDDRWRVERGSALDPDYLAALGTFDLVYSWGVLHHTGAMWRGIELAAGRVAAGGQLFIAIYNDQGAWSSRWTKIKRLYCSGPLGRGVVTATYIPYQVLRGLAADVVWRRNPMSRYREYGQDRGMSVVHDWYDWLGGYPFEVAKPEEIIDFGERHGFALHKLRTVGGSQGCNEFVMTRAR